MFSLSGRELAAASVLETTQVEKTDSSTPPPAFLSAHINSALVFAHRTDMLITIPQPDRRWGESIGQQTQMMSLLLGRLYDTPKLCQSQRIVGGLILPPVGEEHIDIRTEMVHIITTLYIKHSLYIKQK